MRFIRSNISSTGSTRFVDFFGPFSSEEAHGPSGFIEVDDIIEILSGWKMRPEEIKEALRGHLTADGEHGDNN